MKSPLPENSENARIRPESSIRPTISAHCTAPRRDGGVTKKVAACKRLPVFVASVLACAGVSATASAAIDSNTPYAAFYHFNDAFESASGDGYAKSDGTTDVGWGGATEIELVADRFENTNAATDKALLIKFCDTVANKNTYVANNDSWNDDLGRVAQMLARVYILTYDSSNSHANYLTKAEALVDLAYSRWDETYNSGGIYEQQPPYATHPGKSVLANQSCGYAAALIHHAIVKKGSSDTKYLNIGARIYHWSRDHLFVSSTGQVYTYVYQDGTFDTSSSASTQGMWIEHANMLYDIMIGGNYTVGQYYLLSAAQYLADAQLAAKWTAQTQTRAGGAYNGIFSSLDSKFARGFGHMVSQRNLWNTQIQVQTGANAYTTTYYAWMYDNCDTGWPNRNSNGVINNNIYKVTPEGTPTGSPWSYEGLPSLFQFTAMGPAWPHLQ